VLAHVLVFLSLMLHGCPGHERAYLCSPASLFVCFWLCADTQDMSEHICARLHPCLSVFDSVQTPRTRVSTSVLAHVLVFLSLMLHGCPGQEQAHLCSPISLFVCFRLHVDAQDMSEHICAHPCPCLSLFDSVRMPRTRASTDVLACVLVFSLFDAMRMPRTWVSTDVLTCVLVFLSSMPHGCPGHKRAQMCSPVSLSLCLGLLVDAEHEQAHLFVSWVLLLLLFLPPEVDARTWVSTPVLAVSWASLFLPVQDPMNAQGMSEHTSARLCPVCYYSFYSMWVHGTWSGCPGYDLYVFVIAPSTFCGCTGHEWVYWCSCMSCMSVYYYPWHCECPEHEWALLAYVVGILNSISLTHMYIYIYCNNVVIDIK